MTTKRLLAILENVKRITGRKDLGLDFANGGVRLTNASGSHDFSHRMNARAMSDVLYTLIALDSAPEEIRREPLRKNPSGRAAHWIIVRDYVSGDIDNLPQYNAQDGTVSGIRNAHKEVAIFGPRSASKPDMAALPLEFIVADDDGNVYYYGMADEHADFQPLDMFAGPNDGATTIAYKRGGKWEAL